MIPISPRGGKNNLLNFNKRCQEEINSGHVVLIFAEGTVSRNGHTQPFKKGVEHIAKGIDAPIIPINLEGVLGTPLTFTHEHPRAIMPTFKNMRTKIVVAIGQPLASSTSVYIVRQKIIELGVQSFAARVLRKATLGRWIMDIKTKKNLLQDTNGMWMNGKTVKRKSLTIAKRLHKTLQHEKKVALLHRNDVNFNLFVYGLAILGKEIIILNPEKKLTENKQILNKLSVNVCINGIGKSENPCSGYISAKKVMEKLRLGEKIRISLFQLFPKNWTMKMLGNKQGKYRNAVTFAQKKEGKIQGNSMTNTTILAACRALQQVHLTSAYGTLLNLHSPFASLGFYLDILLPATLQIPITKGHFSEANTLVGLVKDVEEVICKLSRNTKLSKVLMDNEPISTALRESLSGSNISIFQGFGIRDLSPIIAVNTPNFEGKDIVGVPLVQKSNNPETVGRPLPSIAIKIVKENLEELGVNEWGKILIKGASVSKQFVVDQYDNLVNTCWDWVDTNVIGMIDEEGYLRVVGE